MKEEVWIDKFGYLCVFNMSGCKGLLERPFLMPNSNREDPLVIGEAYISDHTDESLKQLGFEKLGDL